MAAIVAAVVLVVAMERTSNIAAYRVAMMNLGGGMARQTEHWFASVDKTLVALPRELGTAADGTLDEISAAMRSRQAFDLLVAARLRLPGVDSIALVGPDGRTLASSRAWPAPAADIAIEDFFPRTNSPDDRDLFVGLPVKDEATGRWTALLARRIVSRAGAYVGFAVAEISLTDLEEFYRTAMPPARTIAVMRRDGTVLARYPHLDDRIGRKPQEHAPWHAFVARGGGAYNGPASLADGRIIASINPLRNVPLVVEALVTEDLALVDWYRQRVLTVLGGVFAAIGMILLLRLLARQYSRLERSELSLAAKNQQLQIAHQQFDAALSNLSQGVSFFDGQQRLIVCNRRYAEVYHVRPEAIRPGITLAEISDLRLAVGSFPDTAREEFLRSVQEICRAGATYHYTSDLKDGRTISIVLQPLPEGGWVGTHEDITERRSAEQKIAFLARHDGLTGLPNRGLLLERIGQALAEARRGAMFAVLFLDLDRFKSVNDTLGHQVGDDLLRGVAARLLASVRELDTVARIGGDEFVILQHGVKAPEDASRLALRILAAFREPHRLRGNELVAATSIGIALSTHDGDTAEGLVKNADLALYIAKGEGRGTFRFFEPEMDAKAQNRHALELDLRNAISRGEFEVYYQPIVNLASGRVAGLEALLRWNHPTRGMVGPADFIPVAEECGLIVPIGAFVLGQACAQAAVWPSELRVSVNMSAVQFRVGNLGESVREALAQSGLSPDRLELEITETLLLQNNQATVAALHHLRGLGVAIAMDDFGVGYSSLSYLRSFPFDRIKIDRSFVSDLSKRNDCLFIIRAIVGLCRNLGIATTVEGVETAEQLAILRAEGCTEAQGYLFGRPEPVARLAGLLGDPSLLPRAQRPRVAETAAADLAPTGT
jgi:diguanylate cyclase (GGDEF)-like protein